MGDMIFERMRALPGDRWLHFVKCNKFSEKPGQITGAISRLRQKILYIFYK